METVTIQRVSDGGNVQLRREQAGFRKGRSTSEHILVSRDSIVEVIEYMERKPVCMLC